MSTLPIHQNDAGLVFNLGIDQWGDLEWGVGLRQSQTHGNGIHGGHHYQEFGVMSESGAYARGGDTHWSPWHVQDQHWGVSGTGQYANQSYSDILGNHAHDHYASNVWGDYRAGSTRADNWGFRDHQVAGNAYWGNRSESFTMGDRFGRFAQMQTHIPPHGAHHYLSHGGGHICSWFV